MQLAELAQRHRLTATGREEGVRHSGPLSTTLHRVRSLGQRHRLAVAGSQSGLDRSGGPLTTPRNPTQPHDLAQRHRLVRPLAALAPEVGRVVGERGVRHGLARAVVVALRHSQRARHLSQVERVVAWRRGEGGRWVGGGAARAVRRTRFTTVRSHQSFATDCERPILSHPRLRATSLSQPTNCERPFFHSDGSSSQSFATASPRHRSRLLRVTVMVWAERSSVQPSSRLAVLVDDEPDPLRLAHHARRRVEHARPHLHKTELGGQN